MREGIYALEPIQACPSLTSQTSVIHAGIVPSPLALKASTIRISIDGDATETTKITTEPLVKLNRVSVSYGEGTRPVLKDVSWEIKPGEC
jgi:ABC-type molybdenum transport system ATPase subunit/photorepair protein PhrA